MPITLEYLEKLIDWERAKFRIFSDDQIRPKEWEGLFTQDNDQENKDEQ